MTNREEADAFCEAVTEPLRKARDFAHGRKIVHRDRVAGWMEELIDAVLRIAYDHEGRIARGDDRKENS